MTSNKKRTTVWLGAVGAGLLLLLAYRVALRANTQIHHGGPGRS